MMLPRFVLVGLGFEPKNIPAVDAIIMSEAFDWARYGSTNYIVWTSSDLETIVRKLLRVPGLEHAFILASPLDTSQYFGSLPNWMWDWLKQDRGQGNVIEKIAPLLPAARFLGAGYNGSGA